MLEPSGWRSEVTSKKKAPHGDFLHAKLMLALGVFKRISGSTIKNINKRAGFEVDETFNYCAHK